MSLVGWLQFIFISKINSTQPDDAPKRGGKGSSSSNGSDHAQWLSKPPTVILNPFQVSIHTLHSVVIASGSTNASLPSFNTADSEWFDPWTNFSQSAPLLLVLAVPPHLRSVENLLTRFSPYLIVFPFHFNTVGLLDAYECGVAPALVLP